MKTPVGIARVAVGCLATTLLAACATESNPSAPVSPPPVSPALAVSPAAAAVAKLSKNLTGAQVIALLGPPATTKPLSSGGDRARIWSYPFRGTTEVHPVAVGTQEIPAMNPLTGRETTRSEPVYQNQTVDVTDTLHLLMLDDRLIEWSVVRDEKKQFQ